MVRWSLPKQPRMSRPRASDSTKSGPDPRPATSAAGRRVGGEVGVLVGVVEQLVVGEVGVHALHPDLLAEGRAEVVDGRVDLMAYVGEVHPDQPVVLLHDLPADQDG